MSTRTTAAQAKDAPARQAGRHDGVAVAPTTALPENGRRPTTVDVADEGHQLPPHRGKLGRIQDSAFGTVASLREWVDLRLELAKAEIEEMISEKQEQAKFGVIMGLVAALAGLFLLLTLGFAFSALFSDVLGWAQVSSLAAGFGVVMVILAAITGIIYLRSPFRGGDE